MRLRISLLYIIIGMLFTSCGLSTRKVAEQKEGEISVLRYDKLLSEYVRSNSFSAMQKLTMDYRQPTKILIEDVLSIGTVKDDTIQQRLQNSIRILLCFGLWEMWKPNFLIWMKWKRN